MAKKLEQTMNKNKYLDFFTNDENKIKFYRFIAPSMDQNLEILYGKYKYLKPISDIKFSVTATFGKAGYDVKLSTTYYFDIKYKIDKQGHGVYGNWHLENDTLSISDSAPEIVVYYLDTLDLNFYTALLHINENIDYVRVLELRHPHVVKCVMVVGNYDPTNNISLDSIKHMFGNSNISIVTLAELFNI